MKAVAGNGSEFGKNSLPVLKKSPYNNRTMNPALRAF